MNTTQLLLQLTLSSFKHRNIASSLYLAHWRNQGIEANFQKFQHPWSPSDTHVAAWDTPVYVIPLEQ